MKSGLCCLYTCCTGIGPAAPSATSTIDLSNNPPSWAPIFLRCVNTQRKYWSKERKEKKRKIPVEHFLHGTDYFSLCRGRVIRYSCIIWQFDTFPNCQLKALVAHTSSGLLPELWWQAGRQPTAIIAKQATTPSTVMSANNHEHIVCGVWWLSLIPAIEEGEGDFAIGAVGRG